MSQPAAPMSIVQALERDSSPHRGFTFVADDRSEAFVSFEELRNTVSRQAKSLLDSGIELGDPVALVIPDAREFVTSFLAVVWAGAIPVPLYPPVSLGKQDAYIHYLGELLASVAATCMITPKWIDEVLGLSDRLRAHIKLVAHSEALQGDGMADPKPRLANDTTFLQFTSGSTGNPKAVVVNDTSLWINTRSFVTQLGCNETDHIVSWLPLYHDMGLVGKMLAPLLFSLNATFLPTLGFLRDPGLWLDAITSKRGTMSFAPNFAFALTTKKAQPPESGWDLSSMRVFGCAAEPINPATLDAFIDRFAPHGLAPQAIVPGYGMAEATLGVTLDRLDRRFRCLEIDADAYQAHGAVSGPKTGEETLAFVSCGRVFAAEHALRITDDDGSVLPESQLGNVQFRGPSLAAGYYRNESATAETFKSDGWLATGDRGFLHDGDLYITGRKKDILIVNGRNYDPHYLEWAAADVPGIRKGNVVAFAAPGEATEDIIVAAERTSRLDDHPQKVRSAVWQRTRLVVTDVVLLEPGQLPKTSSGKVQRSRTRDLYLAGNLVSTSVPTRTHAHVDTATA